MIRFTIPGVPVAKGRPRFSRGKKFVRTYTPKKTVAFEQQVGLVAKMEMKRNGFCPFDGALTVYINVYVQIPASWSKAQKAAAVMGVIWPTSKPDWDNYYKAVTDGMNGLVWKDDSQIVMVSGCKKYDANPRTEVDVSFA